MLQFKTQVKDIKIAEGTNTENERIGVCEARETSAGTETHGELGGEMAVDGDIRGRL